MKTSYWYIWYEVYENGEYVGSGRDITGYKHKSSAVRRARQRWDRKFYSPMTGTTFSYTWVVSQTNPWEKEGE